MSTALHGSCLCHCSMCRRSHGAAFATFARVDANDFNWLSGEKLVGSYESSTGLNRCFCRICGSPLGDRSKDGKLGWINLGSIEGDPGIRPDGHIYVGSKAPWHEIMDDLPQYDEQPPKTKHM